MKKIIYTFSLITLIFGIFYGCQKENLTPQPISEGPQNLNANERNIQGIQNEGNYLNFSSLEELYNKMNELQSINDSQKDLWESQFQNFKSMRKKYNENIVADSLYYDKLLKAGTSSGTNTSESPEITKSMHMYYKHPMPDNEYLLLKNVPSERISWVVNEHGVVRVADVLYQLKHDMTKRMVPADRSNIPLLINATSDIIGKGITVSENILDFYGATGACSYPMASWYKYNFWTVKGEVTFSTKGKLSIYMQVLYSPPKDPTCQSSYIPQFYADVYAYKRNWRGKWVADYATMTYNQSYTMNNNGAFFATDDPSCTLIPSINYTIPPDYGKNYTSGQGSGHVLIFNQYYYPKSTYDCYGGQMVTISNFKAYATRTGGSNGGSITLYH